MDRLHRWLTILWLALGVPVTFILKDSVAWVSFMSAYAIIVGHWGAYQSAKGEREIRENSQGK